MACEGCGGLLEGEKGYSMQTQCGCKLMPAPLGAGLIGSMTCTVDHLRQIQSQLGANQYTVHLVWTRWTGGERGVGDEYITRDETLVPTPEIEDLNTVRKQNTSIGMAEVGSLRIRGISPRYTEPELMGVRPGGVTLGADEEFFWEVVSPASAGGVLRRRFFPRSAPTLKETDFEWVMDLMRAHGDRRSDGSLHA